MYKIYKTKNVLNVHKHCDGGWFWIKYSAYPYIGCEWGCEYCYWRDEKYNPHKPSRDADVLKFKDPFSEYIKVKKDAPKLLKKALLNKPKELIYLDNYQPVDSKCKYARKMLEVCLDLEFPVFINEKSPMLLRDLDILKRINKKSYINVGWSIITTKDDDTRLAFEHKGLPVKSRFEAMKILAENNIMTGTVFMPILPFIYDNEKNIADVVKQTKKHGGKYVLDGGLTLWGHCKTHFYKALARYDKGLILKYNELYNNKERFNKYTTQVHKLTVKYCKKYGLTSYIPRPIKFYPKKVQINKKIAGKFYLKARKLQLSGKEQYKEWSYRKAAWALDDLDKSIGDIFERESFEGLLKIKGIGKSLAGEIQRLL